MMPATKILISLITLVCLSTGCTHSQLRYNHVHQAKSLTGIYERQVLDNLAMFKGNKNALPFFAVPEAGSADVTDSGAISASPLNGPGHTILGLSSLSRNNRGGWTIKPISDPARLKLMRCAYRRAIGLSNPNDPCIDCCALQQNWAGKVSTDVSVCCDCCQIRPLKLEVVGKRLAHDPCEKVGSYCGTHIRVCPESYDDLTQLVLTILDYSVNEQKAKKATATATVNHIHYKKDPSTNAYLLDQAGNFVVDYIDTFEAKAHPFKFTEDDGSVIEIEPIERSTVESLDEPLSNLLKESILQRKRATLLPQF